MLSLSNLKPKIRKPAQIRRGRGASSGKGGYSGRGIKGQKARSGGSIRSGFEGGRMPLIRQFPKVKGFKSIHPKTQIVSAEILATAKVFPDGSEITPKILALRGFIRSAKLSVKIIGRSAIGKKFRFKDILFSAPARESFEKSGSTIINVENSKSEQKISNAK